MPLQYLIIGISKEDNFNCQIAQLWASGNTGARIISAINFKKVRKYMVLYVEWSRSIGKFTKKYRVTHIPSH